MPGTLEERLDIIHRMLDHEIMPDDLSDHVWADGTQCGIDDFRDLVNLVLYERERLAKPKRAAAQRRAMGLLRSFLNAEQLRTLRNDRQFYVVGSLGGIYRIWPRVGLTRQVERHGKRLWQKTAFCLHDRGEQTERMPPADLALTHMLWLLEDEANFLATANHTQERQMQWDGEWRRRLNRARRKREESAQAGE